jgi:predicted DNA-binding protein (UPF0251 family)
MNFILLDISADTVLLLAYAIYYGESIMPRPVKCRKVGFIPDVLYFKPAGIPMRELDEVDITLDELEALRLADLEGLYQEDAAGHMNVSRQTFANIIASARRKIAEGLVYGKALRIEGGTIDISRQRSEEGRRICCRQRKRCCRKTDQEETP